jgi:hypothetical protein
LRKGRTPKDNADSYKKKSGGQQGEMIEILHVFDILYRRFIAVEYRNLFWVIVL